MVPSFSFPFPRVLRIEPAGACNLACVHCPTGTVPLPRGVMMPDTFERTMGTLRRQTDKVKVVVLYHGGEPLLNKRFPEMVAAVKAIGPFFVKTVSNGMLLSDELASTLVTTGLDSIEFSLDGTSAEINDQIRRKSNFETIVQNVRRLMLYKQHHKSATPTVYISTTQFLNPATDNPRQDPAIPEHLRSAFSDLPNAIEGFKACYAMVWPHMNVDAEVFDVYHDPGDTEIRTTCDHVESTVTVRWNGDVVSCCYDLTSRYVLGNVHNADLETIWNNDRYQRLRQTIAAGRFISLCKGCNVVAPGRYLLLKERAGSAVLPDKPAA